MTLSTPHHADTRNLVITRVLDAPRHAIWRAWSDPEWLKVWWTPKPGTTDVIALDLQPGGAFHTRIQGPGDCRSEHIGCFLEVIPHARIVFTSMLAAGWRPAMPGLAFTTLISLSDYALGSCYTVQVIHQDEITREQHEKSGFFEGWNTAISQLEEVACTLR
ncbi:SRPBCC domain-containing protein [Candidatus Symbiopectobacterium sp. NZEC151]|uniref:SRPBCC domain-containing protein n=1 Tax=Candidatus Symbiopectobacterium sp. NZEC151 TaxID=2820470 RepID=UPI002226C083|nr:SRPBCC domain-containing protein [Candidatus Symbiopectobacterium sp. NZEC151]MCW2477328.1 SRPBCC domain-containing protein [Candidatus Symbiopectobacterium sp. NZEC151]